MSRAFGHLAGGGGRAEAFGHRTHWYWYQVDLDERGEFKFHVMNENGKTIYRSTRGLHQDWHRAMRNNQDMEGLEKFLKQIGKISMSGRLLNADKPQTWPHDAKQYAP